VKVAIPKLPEYYCTECGICMGISKRWNRTSHKTKDRVCLYHPDYFSRSQCVNSGKVISVEYDEFWSIRNFPEVVIDKTTIPTTHKAADGPIKG